MHTHTRSRRVLAALGCTTLVVAATGACSYTTTSLEPTRTVTRQTSKVLAADGTLLTTLHGEENRETVPLSEIPKTLRDAVVAIEDERFWEHKGVDLRATLRAAYEDAAKGRVLQGGSTITQQYVKNALLGSERTVQPQGARGGARLPPRASRHQGEDPRALPQHDLLREQRLRRAGRVHHVLRRAREPPRPRAVRAPRRRDPGARRLRPLRRIPRPPRSGATRCSTGWWRCTGSRPTWPTPPRPLRWASSGRRRRSAIPPAYFVDEVKRQLLDDPAFGAGNTPSGPGGQRVRRRPARLHDARPAPAAAGRGRGRQGADASGQRPVGARSCRSTRERLRAGAWWADATSSVPVRHDQVNLATQAHRQAGSSFKPIVLAAALARRHPAEPLVPAPRPDRHPSHPAEAVEGAQLRGRAAAAA